MISWLLPLNVSSALSHMHCIFNINESQPKRMKGYEKSSNIAVLTKFTDESPKQSQYNSGVLMLLSDSDKKRVTSLLSLQNSELHFSTSNFSFLLSKAVIRLFVNFFANLS